MSSNNDFQDLENILNTITKKSKKKKGSKSPSSSTKFPEPTKVSSSKKKKKYSNTRKGASGSKSFISSKKKGGKKNSRLIKLKKAKAAREAAIARAKAAEAEKIREQEEIERQMEEARAAQLQVVADKKKQIEDDKKAGIYFSKSQRKFLAKSHAEAQKLIDSGIVPSKHTTRNIIKHKKHKKPKSTNSKGSTIKRKGIKVIYQSSSEEVEESSTDDDWEDISSDPETGYKQEYNPDLDPLLATDSVDNPLIKKILNSDDNAKAEKDVRSPILVVMGHVDTGKTKILDYIRSTSVQEGEEGGITQQIGATFFPIEALLEKTAFFRQRFKNLSFTLPGLLVIDTPGHESFSNLRSRGSSLCDLAILVVDIMHALEQQTFESITMLRDKNVPFIVALNKVDRVFEWNAQKDSPIQACLKRQSVDTMQDFDEKVKGIKFEFQKLGINTCLYWKNKNPKTVVSLVPTSAHTGEGLPDLLTLILQLSQKFLIEKFRIDDTPEATILEVKQDKGLGSVIDIILSNGDISIGDKMVICGFAGAFRTHVRILASPQPLKEIRVNSPYVFHERIVASLCIRIAGDGLKDAIAGSSVYFIPRDVKLSEDDWARYENLAMEEITTLNDKYNGTKQPIGVHVQSSTLGALEALLNFLKKSNIPVSSVSIGPILSKDVARARTQIIKDHPEYAIILAFDVTIAPEVEIFAKEQNVTVFNEKIIYKLFKEFIC